MSPNVVSFNNGDFPFFIEISCPNSTTLEVESTFCGNNEEILQVKKVILFLKK